MLRKIVNLSLWRTDNFHGGVDDDDDDDELDVDASSTVQDHHQQPAAPGVVPPPTSQHHEQQPSAAVLPITNKRYFLTHCHEHATTGLSDEWDKGRLYCSDTTRKLLLLRFPKLERRTVALDLNVWTRLYAGDDTAEDGGDDTAEEGHPRFAHSSPSAADKGPPSRQVSLDVIIFEAYHCPGSCCFLFRSSSTTSTTSKLNFWTAVHSGDFRYCDFLTARMRAALIEWPDFNDGQSTHLAPRSEQFSDDVSTTRVDEIWLDNTCCHPKFIFDDQDSVINEIVHDIARLWPATGVLIELDDDIGKELLLERLSIDLHDCHVCLTNSRYQLLGSIGRAVDSIDSYRQEDISHQLLNDNNLFPLTTTQGAREAKLRRRLVSTVSSSCHRSPPHVSDCTSPSSAVNKLLTADYLRRRAQQGAIWVCPKDTLRAALERISLLLPTSADLSRFVGILTSGCEAEKVNGICCGIKLQTYALSSHSSFLELCQFVSDLNPTALTFIHPLPTPNFSDDGKVLSTSQYNGEEGAKLLMATCEVPAVSLAASRLFAAEGRRHDETTARGAAGSRDLEECRRAGGGDVHCLSGRDSQTSICRPPQQQCDIIHSRSSNNFCVRGGLITLDDGSSDDGSSDESYNDSNENPAATTLF